MATQCPKCQFENTSDSKFCKECGTQLLATEDIGVTKTIITPTVKFQKGSTVADRYQLIEELGRGGMGVVYKAEDTKLKRMVALKFLPPELTHIPDVKDRFMREAQAAAALDHPNICTVYEFDEAEEKTFISMAYVEGQSLRKKLESGPLKLDDALRIATQVAEGLQMAHKKGVIHRDIKSANIMVDDRNQAKIMDFGLARMTGTTLLTQEGAAMGTIAYMSPEQAQGKEVDHRTDIWSFGVVLYEMLTGELPFKGEHEQAIVYSILKEKPEPITDLKTDIPVSIVEVVGKALEKDPDKRYKQAEELLDDLKSISAGIVPEEIKLRLRKEKLRRRKRAILYAGAAGLIIILAVLGLTLLKGPPETIDSIAVLPLENLTGDAEQEYFVDGVTDELIGQLGQISGLQRVISRTSVMRYKDTDKSLPEIARELNVDALVEGTVYQVGENVSIKLQLFDALPEERSLWTQRYDRPVTDVLVMYGEMAGAIAENIQVKLSEDETSRFAGVRQVNPEAYDAYLKGLHHSYKLLPVDLDTAFQYFELALKKDPNYALAYTGISFIWGCRQQMGITPAKEAGPKAKEAALKSLALDDTLAEAHYALANIVAWSEWDWPGAEKEFKRTIEINPNFPDARIYYSHLLNIMGRPDEAMAQLKRALELDPYNSLFQSVAAADFLMVRRYDEALAQARSAQRTNAEDPVAHTIAVITLFMKGAYKETFAEWKAFWSSSSYGNRDIVEALDQGYSDAGFTGAMKRAADVWAKLGTNPWYIAVNYIMAEEKDRALEWLEKAFELRDPNMSYLCLPCFDSVRSDPRFQELLRKMNLPVDEKE